MPTILQHRPDGWRDVAPAEGPPGMVWIEAGVFHMGSDRHYPEEAPVRRVAVEGFWIDRTPVTNDNFTRFVDATGHVTVAERQPEARDFPDADPALLVPGSLVFGGPQVWVYVPGAHWRQPQGRAAVLQVWAVIPWCMSRMRMRLPTPPGLGSSCRPRRSGSLPRGAGWTARILPGVTC